MSGEAPDYYIDPERGPVCVRCGGVRRPGDWPHCKGNPEDHKPGKYGFEGFGEYVDEHLLPPDDPRARDIGPNGAGETVRGVRITSREQRKRLMRENNVDWHGRKIGRKGCMI